MGSLDLSAQQIPRRDRDWKPSAVYLSGETVGLLKSTSKDFKHFELNAKVDFDNLFLAVDYGSIRSILDGDNFVYESNGSFLRVGPQINFMPYNENWSNLFFGLVYARSWFEDQVVHSTPEGIWTEFNQPFENRNMTAGWAEANLGLSAHVIGPLYFGYVVRFRMAMQMSDPGMLRPYEVPGFGAARKASNFGFSYYITYRFGFRNKAVPKKPIKPKRLENTGPGNDEEDN